MPKELKKDNTQLYYAFPDIPDLVKHKTYYVEDKPNKVFKLIQVYRALRPGKFLVPPFRFLIQGKTVSHKGVWLTVKNSSALSKPEPEWESLKFQTESDDMSFKVLTDKQTVFAGEGFVVTASFLIPLNSKSKFNFTNLSKQSQDILRSLSTSNCIRDESSKGMIENLTFDTIVLSNKSYKRLKLFESIYYPIQAGDVIFPAVSFSLVRYYTSESKRVVYWKNKELTLKSFPVIIKVKKLPDHPLSDMVPVGNFQLNDRVSTNVLKTGKSFNYDFMITGSGNMSVVMAPQTSENDFFDFYAPHVKQDYIKKSGNFITAKIFSYKIIPKEPGVFRLSDYFHFIYFDPVKEQYDTLKS
ncbi:MAG: BatD family protein, partial [Cytophagaceae bacterium]|nr:BatD family protein [Cytophagaceae bacterium]